MRRLTSPAVLALLALAACDGTATAPRDGDVMPAMAISDAAHGGAAGFYFLPPVVANPGSPTAQFYELYLPATMVRVTDDGGNTVDEIPVTRVGGAERYQALWETRDLVLDPEQSYRITVIQHQCTLGWADVDVLASGNELKNARTGDVIPLVDGHRLNIEFLVTADWCLPPCDGTCGGGGI